MEVAAGRVVTLEYTVRVADGTLVDSTGQCGPIAILHGSEQLFPALEARLVGLRPGDTREIRIPAEEAFGPHNPGLIRMLPRERLPAELVLEVGTDYRIKAPEGRTLRFRVLALTATEVQADFNPRHAGQELLATVTIVDVRAATPDEERRGRVG
jgi:FKBP-type peptidyl-prolyl cis-trans isomerase 2